MKNTDIDIAKPSLGLKMLDSVINICFMSLFNILTALLRLGLDFL